MESKKLYKEMVCGKIVTIAEHNEVIIESELEEASIQEIEEAKIYFSENGKCNNYHLIHDEPSHMYHSRCCGICGQFIDFI